MKKNKIPLPKIRKNWKTEISTKKNHFSNKYFKLIVNYNSFENFDHRLLIRLFKKIKRKKNKNLMNLKLTKY